MKKDLFTIEMNSNRHIMTYEEIHKTISDCIDANYGHTFSDKGSLNLVISMEEMAELQESMLFLMQHERSYSLNVIEELADVIIAFHTIMYLANISRNDIDVYKEQNKDLLNVTTDMSIDDEFYFYLRHLSALQIEAASMLRGLCDKDKIIHIIATLESQQDIVLNLVDMCSLKFEGIKIDNTTLEDLLQFAINIKISYGKQKAQNGITVKKGVM